MPEFTIYFPDVTEDKLPEREYLIAVISTLNKETTKTIVDQARKIRSVQKPSDNDELVAISSQILEEIRSIYLRKYESLNLLTLNYITDNFAKIATSGISNFLMKKNTKLKKARNPIKSFQSNLKDLKPKEGERMSSQGRTSITRYGGSRNIDMEEEDKNANDQ